MPDLCNIHEFNAYKRLQIDVKGKINKYQGHEKINFFNTHFIITCLNWCVMLFNKKRPWVPQWSYAAG